MQRLTEQCPKPLKSLRSAEPPPLVPAAQVPGPTRAVDRLQRAAGNRAVQSLLTGGGIQRQSVVSRPGDPLEREADRVADAVMRRPAAGARRCACGGIADPGGECAACRARRLARQRGLQRQAAEAGAPTPATAAVSETLSAPGESLDPGARRFFEERLGEDLGDVRVHRDTRAGEAARDLEARAFTLGRHVAFAPGEYAPDTSSGRRLLAHELAHVLQQREVTTPVIQRNEGGGEGDETACEILATDLESLSIMAAAHFLRDRLGMEPPPATRVWCTSVSSGTGMTPAYCVVYYADGLEIWVTLMDFPNTIRVTRTRPYRPHRFCIYDVLSCVGGPRLRRRSCDPDAG